MVSATETLPLSYAFCARRLGIVLLAAASPLAVTLLASPASASALAVRTFVASTGSDLNSCGRNAPCRTFQAAVSATAAGGEVVALDSAGFGSNVTINKAISLIAPVGIYGGITVFAGDGIDISAGTSDAITLQGLTLISQGTLGNGIVFSSGAQLHIKDCVINGFSGFSGIGIRQLAGQLFVKDTVVKNGTVGISILGPTNGSIFASMDNVTLTGNNLSGLDCEAFSSGKASAAITRSSISGNTGTAFGGAAGVSLATGDNAVAILDIESCLITNNDHGISLDAGGTNSTEAASISNCVISHNGEGFHIPGGAILTRGNNTILGNGPNLGSLTPLSAQ